MRSTQSRGQVICRIDSHDDRSSEAILLDKQWASNEVHAISYESASSYEFAITPHQRDTELRLPPGHLLKEKN
jgi:hypothetical protein